MDLFKQLFSFKSILQDHESKSNTCSNECKSNKSINDTVRNINFAENYNLWKLLLKSFLHAIVLDSTTSAKEIRIKLNELEKAIMTQWFARNNEDTNNESTSLSKHKERCTIFAMRCILDNPTQYQHNNHTLTQIGSTINPVELNLIGCLNAWIHICDKDMQINRELDSI